jgi:hypothetical protein
MRARTPSRASGGLSDRTVRPGRAGRRVAGRIRRRVQRGHRPVAGPACEHGPRLARTIRRRGGGGAVRAAPPAGPLPVRSRTATEGDRGDDRRPAGRRHGPAPSTAGRSPLGAGGTSLANRADPVRRRSQIAPGARLVDPPGRPGVLRQGRHRLHPLPHLPGQRDRVVDRPEDRGHRPHPQTPRHLRQPRSTHPPGEGYVHFHFSDYGKLTVIGVVDRLHRLADRDTGVRGAGCFSSSRSSLRSFCCYRTSTSSSRGSLAMRSAC